jgi:hypothetical protein
MAKNKKGTKLPKFNLKSTVAVLLAILLIAGGFYVKNYLDQRQLEDNFAVLEQDMTSLKDDIETNIPGAELDEEKYCYRESFKYKEGPLKCSYDLYVKVMKDRTEKTHKFIENNLGGTNDDTNGIQDYSYKYTRLFCRSIESSVKDDKRTSILLYCNSFSDRSFYPYREN